MTNLINWFEIPVTDMTRARTFYETIFSNTMHEMTLANDLVSCRSRRCWWGFE